MKTLVENGLTTLDCAYYNYVHFPEDPELKARYFGMLDMFMTVVGEVDRDENGRHYLK